MEHGQASAGEVGLREGRSVSAPIRVGRATKFKARCAIEEGSVWRMIEVGHVYNQQQGW